MDKATKIKWAVAIVLILAAVVLVARALMSLGSSKADLTAAPPPAAPAALTALV